MRTYSPKDEIRVKKTRLFWHPGIVDQATVTIGNTRKRIVLKGETVEMTTGVKLFESNETCEIHLFVQTPNTD